MSGTVVPTNVRQAWQAGAAPEARARNEGLDREARSFLDYAVASLRGGRTVDRTVEGIAVVYTAEWSLRDRLRLAWRMVRHG